MEGGEVARVPSLAESGGAQIPVGPDLARYHPQVAPEVDDRGPAPEPIAVINAVDNEARLEHERMRNHRIMLRVGILRDVEGLLNRSFGVGEEGPLGAHRRAELLDSVVVIGGDGSNLCICHSDFRIKRGEIEMLLVFFRAVVATRKRQDQWVIALEFAEPAQGARVIGQLKVGKNGPSYDIGTHMIISLVE